MSDTPALSPETAKFLARLVRSQQLAVAAPDFRRVSEQIAAALDQLDDICAHHAKENPDADTADPARPSP